MDISNDNRVGKDFLIHGTSRYEHVEPGNNISYVTRVNSSSNSSDHRPRKIIEGRNLRYDDDYLEWRIEMRGGRKVATEILG